MVAVDFDVGLPAPGEKGVALAGESSAPGGVKKLLLELEEEGLGVGLDVFDEVEIGLFDFGIVGVAAFVDVATIAEFVDDGREFGEIGQPFFQVGRGSQGAPEELIVERLELGPVGEVDFFGDVGSDGGACWHGWFLLRSGRKVR